MCEVILKYVLPIHEGERDYEFKIPNILGINKIESAKRIMRRLKKCGFKKIEIIKN